MLSTYRLAVVSVTLLLAVPAQAQTAQRFSLQGSLLGTTVGGEAFDGIDVEAGGGFELQARWNPSAFSIGAGIQSTFHPASFEGFDVEFSFLGFFLEPRYVFFVGSDRAAPYASLRLMSLVATVRVPEFDFEDDLDASGWAVGGGVMFVLSRRVNLDLGLTFGSMTFTYDDPQFEDDSGSSVVARLGIAIGL